MRVVRPRDVMHIATFEQSASVDRFLEENSTGRIPTKEISKSEAKKRFPALREEGLDRVVVDEGAGDIDVHCLHQAYLNNFLKNGGQVKPSTRIDSATRNGDHWNLETKMGDIPVDLIVNAAGAWGDQVATRAGVEPVGLQPRRRTAFTVNSSEPNIQKWGMIAGIRPSAAVIGEPTGLRMVGAHKGCYEYRTTVSGMNGHSSLPGEAVSAVHYATRWISALLSLTDEMEGRAPNPSPYNPPATTFNVGTITGGQGRCVVADLCWFDWEMRPVQAEDAAFVKEHMAAIESGLLNEMKTVFPEASIQTEVICEIDGLEWSVDSKAIDLMKLLLANNEETKHNLKVEVVSYGTEAGLFQAANIPSVLWGPGSGHIGSKLLKTVV